MPAVTFTIEPDELLGLNALVTLDKTDAGSDADADASAVDAARALMHTALAGKLTEAGLPWAPSPESVRQRTAAGGEPDAAAQLAGDKQRLRDNKKLRRAFGYTLAVAALVVLWGGYSREWSWTGFQANRQLWDWLQLLLLPLVFPTILLPMVLRWITGNAAQRASEATDVPAAETPASEPADELADELAADPATALEELPAESVPA